MPFDEMRGVGYLIGRTALVLSADQAVTLTNSDTERVTLIVPAGAIIRLIQATVNYGSGSTALTPRFEIERNGESIDELQWADTISNIQASTQQSLLYAYKQESSDQVYGGDTYALRLQQSGVGVTTYNVSFIVIGTNT